MLVNDYIRATYRRAGVMLSHVRKAVWLLLATLTLASVGAPGAHAQMLPDSSSYGSSNDDSRNSDRRSRDDRNGRSVDAGGAVSDIKIEPVEVSGSDRPSIRAAAEEASPRLKPPPPPSEFEQFVERAIGRKLPRFGADLLLPSNRDYAVPATATVPPGYVLNVGDIVAISMTGSIEGSVDKEIDTNGRIFLPRVGSIQLAGVRYGDLKDVISAAIGTQYRAYTVNVGIRHLRGLRIYVTGFANNPGAYSLNSLSTMSNAVLAAGGPAAGGSFRSAKLYRNNELIGDFDLYQFILGGSKAGDMVLQNEDVLFIPPVGEQVAITGSVNAEAIYESKPGETLATLVSFAGGLNSLADASRLMLYRPSNFDTVGVLEVSRAEADTMAARGGDIIKILSEGTLLRPVSKQSVLVRIEGEVNAPGNYYVPANTPLSTVLEKAGGLTPRAFVFGTRFERSSVRLQQRESFNEAIQQLEISLAASPLTADQSQGAGERSAQLAGARAVLDRLREAEPDGRVVFDLPPTASVLPGDIILENNDRIVVPPRPTTVGVFGAVYRPASFALNEARPQRVGDYIERAGGPLRAADKKGIFVVRANGAVLSHRNGALKSDVLPGDVIFVPVKAQAGSTWAKIRDIASTVFQLGLGAATLVAITK
jgi:polysaccharide export outer membrane protein